MSKTLNSSGPTDEQKLFPSLDEIKDQLAILDVLDNLIADEILEDPKFLDIAAIPDRVEAIIDENSFSGEVGELIQYVLEIRDAQSKLLPEFKTLLDNLSEYLVNNLISVQKDTITGVSDVIDKKIPKFFNDILTKFVSTSKDSAEWIVAEILDHMHTFMNTNIDEKRKVTQSLDDVLEVSKQNVDSVRQLNKDREDDEGRFYDLKSALDFIKDKVEEFESRLEGVETKLDDIVFVDDTPYKRGTLISTDKDDEEQWDSLRKILLNQVHLLKAISRDLRVPVDTSFMDENEKRSYYSTSYIPSHSSGSLFDMLSGAVKKIFSGESFAKALGLGSLMSLLAKNSGLLIGLGVSISGLIFIAKRLFAQLQFEQPKNDYINEAANYYSDQSTLTEILAWDPQNEMTPLADESISEEQMKRIQEFSSRPNSEIINKKFAEHFPEYVPDLTTEEGVKDYVAHYIATSRREFADKQVKWENVDLPEGATPITIEDIRDQDDRFWYPSKIKGHSLAEKERFLESFPDRMNPEGPNYDPDYKKFMEDTSVNPNDVWEEAKSPRVSVESIPSSSSGEVNYNLNAEGKRDPIVPKITNNVNTLVYKTEKIIHPNLTSTTQ